MYNECPMRWKLNYVDDLRIFESNIYLIFGTAMHEVLQKYLEVMYYDTAKRADMIGLDRVLREKMVEGFKQAEESEGKAPCTKQELQEFDGQEIIFEIFPEDCPNQVEQGTLSFDAEDNAIVTFDDGETMSIKADQVIDTFDNWSKENFS